MRTFSVCPPNGEEFKVIDLVLYVFWSLGFEDFTAQVSLRDPKPEKYIGSNENWDLAENAIINAAKEELSMSSNTEKPPSMVKWLWWKMPRTQVGDHSDDYNLPERDLSYKGNDNELHRPVMIHRAPFGSLERFGHFVGTHWWKLPG